MYICTCSRSAATWGYLAANFKWAKWTGSMEVMGGYEVSPPGIVFSISPMQSIPLVERAEKTPPPLGNPLENRHPWRPPLKLRPLRYKCKLVESANKFNEQIYTQRAAVEGQFLEGICWGFSALSRAFGGFQGFPGAFAASGGHEPECMSLARSHNCPGLSSKGSCKFACHFFGQGIPPSACVLI